MLTIKISGRLVALALTIFAKCVFCAARENVTTEVAIVTADSNNVNMLRAARDTYLEAYFDSHGGSAPFPKKQINREENYPSAGDNYYPKPQTDYGPPIYTNHPPPETTVYYHQPKIVTHPSDTYGAPTGPSGPGPSYSAPSGPSSGPYPPSIVHTSYGPPPVPAWPAPVYGPPQTPPPAYGPPPMLTEMPHAMLGLLDKFKMKLDFYTMLKILLKVIIFKKIVKFMAILCLLLFIPYFKPKEDSSDSDMAMMDDDDDDERSSRNLIQISTKADERLNRLTSLVYDAIATYTKNDITIGAKSTPCQGTLCRIQKVLDNVDKKYSFGKLFSLYYSNARTATNDVLK